MSYKDSLLLPKTDFEMRANLPKKEPIYLEKWNEMDLYNKILERNKDKKPFVFHDGPPYANGNMHMGHVLNKTLKDIVFKSKNMLDYYCAYIPGWDTHGLPIEQAITNSGIDRKSMSTYDFRAYCYDYALKQVDNQKNQLIRLGTIADYKNPYLTLNKDFEARQVEVFAKMALKGLIYKGLKPVYWSYSSESALAEAEIEYQDIKSPAIYVKFSVNQDSCLPDNSNFVIWTTTPWTIPANLAICLNPDLTYGVFSTEKGNLVFLEEKRETLQKEFELETCELIKTFKGSELEGITTKHPLYERNSAIILGDHVTNDAGTGCVHTAPGHGEDDFIVGKKYNLDVLCPVDEKGCMTSDAGEDLVGLHFDKANKVVTTKLNELGALLKLEFITHSYPHDWRTKKPVIYRATDQWFASIDKIRNEVLEQIDKVEWKPSWGHARLHNMIRDRGDWCISRQRIWGVPLPIIYTEAKTPIIEKEVFEHIANLFREHGSNIWFNKTAKELLPENYTHKDSPNGEFTKETDIMDVWFDSGSSHTGVLVERNQGYPADLYLEGSDQYRGWFNSSLITGVAIYGQSPYKQIVSHGYVVDGKGYKLSKSAGNGVDPLKVMDQYGADILRLWVASINYEADAKVSDELLKQVSENYRKIRNTLRFLLGNINDFTNNDIQNDLETVDKFILIKLNEVIEKTKTYYEQYRYNDIVQIVTNFATNELSSFYLDFTKDILYIEAKDNKRRRQVQTVLNYVVKALMRLVSPILSFTAEESYNFYLLKEEDSIFLTDYPNTIEIKDENNVLETINLFLLVRGDVLKALEIARNDKVIGKSLEAKVKINLKKPINLTAEMLKQMLIVSSLELVENNQMTEYDNSYIEVTKFDGLVCERCWSVFAKEEMHDEQVCSRCHDVVSK